MANIIARAIESRGMIEMHTSKGFFGPRAKQLGESHIIQRYFQPVMTAIVLTAAMLLACVPASATVLHLNDNLIHNLNSAVTETIVSVENSTILNLLTGGSIEDDLKATDDSTVNVSGGTIGDNLEARDDSTLNFSGGLVGDDLLAFDNSELNVSGGNIVDRLTALDFSTVNISGGFVGAVSEGVHAVDNSEVTIFGTGFNLAYGVYDSSGLEFEHGGSIGTVTGTLANGDAFNTNVFVFNSATVTLAATAVPEPSSIAMFGIGALGLFGYGRRRRQTSTAA